MFKPDFLWGAATAATQIEGAHLEDGKVPSIWDDLSFGRVRYNETCHTACDHYHHLEEDVVLLKQIGVNSYRFSVNWCRIVTDEKGAVNPEGIAFYNRLIDLLLEAGITPLITVYHWDLPMWAYDRGGWKNPACIDWFVEYATVLVKAFSDRVSFWFTMNEPQCFVALGYRDGIHAPFEKLPLPQVYKIARHVMLAHGKAVAAMRQAAKQPLKIGFASANSCACPADDTPEEIEAARQRTFQGEDPFSIAFWSDPMVLGRRTAVQDFLSDEDLAIICQPLDFYAYNTYSSALIPQQCYSGMPKNTLFWTVYPECMYWSVRFYAQRYKLPMLVSENGLANMDYVTSDGKVHDHNRTDFLKTYLTSLKKAAAEFDVLGYLYWSFMDNFEWAEGYDIRFGLVHVDYRTQKRTLKDSALYYREIIRSNAERL